MDPFDLFTESNYTFLQLSGEVEGNVILEETDAIGIVKLRDGIEVLENLEDLTSTSSIHIHPTEPFIATVGGNMVGHGVRVAKDNHTADTYRIIAQVEGYDFDLGVLSFYRVVLKKEDIATWDESSLPLE